LKTFVKFEVITQRQSIIKSRIAVLVILNSSCFWWIIWCYGLYDWVLCVK